jgi:hypothetical protein
MLDASTDHTSPVPDASHDSSLADVIVADTSVHDAQSDTSTVTDGALTGDAAHDGAVDAEATPDASDAGSRDSGSSSDAGDATTPDASDGSSSAADGGDASQEVDAADAAPACVTTLESLGGAATDDAGKTEMILFSFDAADAGTASDFSHSTDSNTTATSTSAVTSTDGYPCQTGALSVTTTYISGNPNTYVYHDYHNPGQNWSGYQKLHVWLKVETTDYATISGVVPQIDSTNYTLHLFQGYIAGSTFVGGGWHESVLDLAASGSFDPTNVNGFQFKLQTTASSDGGVIPQATLLIDSIWLE